MSDNEPGKRRNTNTGPFEYLHSVSLTSLCTNNRDEQAATRLANGQSLQQGIAENTFSSDNFGNEASRSFFRNEHIAGTGISNMVTNSMPLGYRRSGAMADEILNHQLALTSFAWKLSRSERREFSALLKSQEVIVTKQCHNNNKQSLFVPSTEADLRRIYVGDGVNSIASNLPHPPVCKLQNHAYISLHEIISHVLACGLFADQLTFSNDQRFDAAFDHSQTVGGVTDSFAYYNAIHNARALYQDTSVAVLWLAEWQDDFDPNSVKGNRESCWLKTVTVNPLPGAAGGPQQFTFPVALGGKSSDHEEVEELFSDELKRYSQMDHPAFHQNLYYDGHSKSLVTVYAEVIVSLQDQPERRASTHLAAGNSRMHSRFGYSCDYLHIADQMVPCHDCSCKVTPDNNCTQCTNWETNPGGEGGLTLTFPPPDNFPRDIPADFGDQVDVLLPVQITFPLLLGAFEEAYTNIVAGTWSLSNGSAYLKRFCVRENTIKFLLGTATSRHRLLAARQAISDNPANEEAAKVIQEMSTEPSLTEKPNPPSTWTRGVPLTAFAEAPMHLLFLGVTKTILSDINEWATNVSGYSALQRYGNDLLDDVPKLSWCKTLSFSGRKLGGWVSENYLAFSRLLVWFYSPLGEVVVEEDYDEPETEVCKWTVVQCRKWLKAHGITNAKIANDQKDNHLKRLSQQTIASIKALPKEKGSGPASLRVQPLREIVNSYKTTSAGQLVKVSSKAASVVAVQSLVIALRDMIYQLMQSEQTQESILKSGDSIKNFLSVYAEFEKKQRESSGVKQPCWVKHYNFLSLLNLVNMQLRYGPIRNLWEGSSLGEGYIQVLKSEMGCGLGQGTWSAALLVRVLKKKSLQILGSKQRAEPPVVPDHMADSYQEIMYRDLAALLSAFSSRRPLKGVLIGKTHFLVTRDGERRLVKMTHPLNKSGCSYFVCTLSDEPAHEKRKTEEGEGEPMSPFIMLPLVGQNGVDFKTELNVYTTVYQDWSVIDNNSVKRVP